MCSLLLSHGADPSLLNCHSKSAVDVCPSDDLQEKLQCTHISVLEFNCFTFSKIFECFNREQCAFALNPDSSSSL